MLSKAIWGQDMDMQPGGWLQMCTQRLGMHSSSPFGLQRESLHGRGGLGALAGIGVARALVSALWLLNFSNSQSCACF